MGQRINESYILQFITEANTYPLKVAEGANGLSIVNPSSTEPLTFTVTTQTGRVLSSTVPPYASYDGVFGTITEIDIVSTAPFFAELRS